VLLGLLGSKTSRHKAKATIVYISVHSFKSSTDWDLKNPTLNPQLPNLSLSGTECLQPVCFRFRPAESAVQACRVGSNGVFTPHNWAEPLKRSQASDASLQACSSSTAAAASIPAALELFLVQICQWRQRTFWSAVTPIEEVSTLPSRHVLP